MRCPHIPEIGYGEFSEGLQSRLLAKRVPIAGSIELTHRCNLHCVHCYGRHAHQGLPGLQELTADEFRTILSQIVDEGCLWLLLTGGEPLLRPDFPDIYTNAKRAGLLITLFTNGTLLTSRLADLLAEWRPFAIEITLYGRTQETYERITGVPGSHARCLRGIELLMERELPLRLKTMALTVNAHELCAMRQYAEGLGLNFDFDPVVNPGLDGSMEPVTYRLPIQDIVRLERAEPRRQREWPARFAERVGMHAKSRDLYLCNAGINGFNIDPYGRMSLCLMVREPGFDLRRGRFRDGWLNDMRETRARQRVDESECTRCDLRMVCAQCPGWGLLERGDAEAKVDFLCALTRARVEAFRAQASIV